MKCHGVALWCADEGCCESSGTSEKSSSPGWRDSLEEVQARRGTGRKLPVPPAALSSNTDTNNNSGLVLGRSATFSSGAPARPRPAAGRKLPQLPRAGSLGREQGGGSLSPASPTDPDSGYPSYDAAFGEETSVDAPALLPRRNQHNFLWVELDKPVVTRRPRNHDRLAGAGRRAGHRHSAPPGSLPDTRPAPAPRPSLPAHSDKSGLANKKGKQEGQDRSGKTQKFSD